MNNTFRTFQGDIRMMLGRKKFASMNNATKCKITVEILETRDKPMTLHSVKNAKKNMMETSTVVGTQTIQQELGPQLPHPDVA